jgi:hypothetical protein
MGRRATSGAPRVLQELVKLVVPLTVVLLGIAFTASAATASSPAPHLLTPKPTVGAAGDGRRYFAYRLGDGVVHLRDDRRHKEFRIAVNPACGIIDGARAIFLLWCPKADGSLAPLILGADRRTLIAPPVNSASDPSAVQYTNVGRYWMLGFDPSGHGTCVAKNWHTGEVDVLPSEFSCPLNVDLSSRSLRRTRFVTVESGGVDGAYAAQPLTDPPRLALYQLGHTRRILGQCPGSCDSVTIGAGLVTWTWSARANSATAYDIKRHRRLSWRFGQAAGRTTVAHTLRRVYFIVPQQSTGAPVPHPYIYVARVPR